MALGIPEAQRFPHVSELQDLGTDVTKLMSPALQKNSRFHVQKLWPHCHFVKWPPKNWLLFWGWNVKIWWPVHRKAIKPVEMRRKVDKKTWNPLQNAKQHRIHKYQKGNAATFNYPPGMMIHHSILGLMGVPFSDIPMWETHLLMASWGPVHILFFYPSNALQMVYNLENARLWVDFPHGTQEIGWTRSQIAPLAGQFLWRRSVELVEQSRFSVFGSLNTASTTPHLLATIIPWKQQVLLYSPSFLATSICSIHIHTCFSDVFRTYSFPFLRFKYPAYGRRAHHP